jgi:phospholipid transport system transporter-binding protein
VSELQITGHSILPKGDLVAEKIRSLYEQSPTFESADYEIDLSEVKKSDSAGLALLVYWYRQAGDKNGRIVFKNCPETMLEMARLNGLGEMFVPVV